MKLLMISPGFPDDMPYFARGAAQAGATLYGVGDQPAQALRPEAAGSLADYLRVGDLWNEDQTVATVVEWLGSKRIQVDAVECLWEPGVVLAAKLRQRLGLAGLSIEQAHAFRDKETMKQVLDAAGVRTPHHYRASTADEVREAAGKIGFPVIVKPIDGAGSADTYTARSEEQLEQALARVQHVPEVSVEEFIEGEEYTYDTVCAGGQILFQNVGWYRPKPLTARLTPWISAQAICLRELERPEIAVGVELGHRVLQALGFQTGFTHMEWFRTASGEAVFGEIAARSPGGRLTHGMNVSCNADLFRAWGEAVVRGRIDQDLTKRYNAAMVFKRAEGGGDRISRVEGLERILAEQGENVPLIDLVPIGQPRRDWRKVVTGDGWMVARHPDLQACVQLADRLSSEVRIVAD